MSKQVEFFERVYFDAVSRGQHSTEANLLAQQAAAHRANFAALCEPQPSDDIREAAVAALVELGRVTRVGDDDSARARAERAVAGIAVTLYQATERKGA